MKAILKIKDYHNTHANEKMHASKELSQSFYACDDQLYSSLCYLKTKTQELKEFTIDIKGDTINFSRRSKTSG